MFYACVTRFDVTENLKKNSFLGELNKTLFESFQSFMEINSESPSASMRAQRPCLVPKTEKFSKL